MRASKEAFGINCEIETKSIIELSQRSNNCDYEIRLDRDPTHRGIDSENPR